MPANFDTTEAQVPIYDEIFLGKTDDAADPETLYDGYHFYLSDWSNLCLNIATLSGAKHYKFNPDTGQYENILIENISTINQSIYGGASPADTSYQLRNDINGNIDDPVVYALNPLIGQWIPLVEKIIEFRAKLLLLIEEVNRVEPIVNNFAKLTVSQNDLTALRNNLSQRQLALNASALQLIREEEIPEEGGSGGVVLFSGAGDGSTLSFTLDSSPSLPLFVSVDGVAETAYSTSGNNIIFDVAPAIGASISVIGRIAQEYAYGTVISVRNNVFVLHPRVNTFLVGGATSGAGGSFDHRVTFNSYSDSLLGVGVAPPDSSLGLSVSSVIDNDSEDADITSYSNAINDQVVAYVNQYISDHNTLKSTMQSMIPVIRKGATAVSYHVSDSLHQIVYPKSTGNPFLDDLYNLLQIYETAFPNQSYMSEEAISLKENDIRRVIVPTQYSEKVIGARGVELLQQAKTNLETMDNNLLTGITNMTVDPANSYYTTSSPIVTNLNALKALINA